ncbi:Putative transcriptional regulator [Pseudomonas syringae pv. actinidiae]|uniref:Transcriptional regulator n=1 Tax=Pseudomonas syringae pv. actinidiae TaxID=103796 RepID=A0AAN4PYU8_PSESF|nr:Putative transcriptional regulator [Pseudomonas syringae pv. actinidiae]
MLCHMVCVNRLECLCIAVIPVCGYPPARHMLGRRIANALNGVALEHTIRNDYQLIVKWDGMLDANFGTQRVLLCPHF